MTGLFGLFWRHFAVLTNFSGNEVESRLLLLEEEPGSPQAQGAWGVATGPEGWVPDVPGDARRGRDPAAP